MSDLIDPKTGEVLAPPGDNVLVCFALYQQAAARNGWTQHRFLTEPQRKAIKARLAEAGGMAEWREALELASRSEWLCGKIIGKNGTRFKMDLNFLIQPSKFARVLEGFYTRADGPITSRLTLPTLQPPLKPAEPFKHDIESPEERMAFTISRYRARGKYADGNRVEEQLAALQKRPPVLVPDPTLAWTSAASKPATAAPRATPVDLEWDMVPE